MNLNPLRPYNGGNFDLTSIKLNLNPHPLKAEGAAPKGRRVASIEEHRLEAEAGVGLAAEELAGAGAAGELIFVDDGAAAGENCSGGALDLDAFEHRVVDAHVMRFDADCFAMIRIEDHDVGVGADSDRAFAREEAEKFCGRCGDDFDEAIGREAFAVNAASVDQAEAMLDAGAAVGNFCEVVDAEFFLIFETERAVVGGDDL